MQDLEAHHRIVFNRNQSGCGLSAAAKRFWLSLLASWRFHSLYLRLRISAARSPMITLGTMVFAIVIHGMIAPSATRRFSTP
jgi:hypothetical protein